MILLIGGTSESLEIADELTRTRQAFVLSVTTDYGKVLAQAHAAQVIETKFSDEALKAFIQTNTIQLIVDASHPFAQVVSQMAIEVAAQMKVTYVRFERENTVLNEPNVVRVASQDDVIDYAREHDGQVYLSTGSKTAVEYAEAIGLDRVHVRVLPTAGVLTKLAEGGFKPNQIDAVEGPFSTTLNVELFRKAKAAMVVTKDSGERGGINEKIMAAQALGIPCVVIDRPKLVYPHKAQSVESLMKYVAEVK